MRRTTDLGRRTGLARRWPWALAATAAGAVAGGAVAYVMRRQDRSDAVEPEQLEAVVDRPDGEGHGPA